jgi:hypothetical protein
VDKKNLTKYKVQVGTGIGLTSKAMSKADAERIAHLIDTGGMKVWVHEHHSKRRKQK